MGGLIGWPVVGGLGSAALVGAGQPRTGWSGVDQLLTVEDDRDREVLLAAA